jgi:hypothetical protein
MGTDMTTPPPARSDEFRVVGGFRGPTTMLRCGGCGAAATLAQQEPHYGQLVHGFLDRHDPCAGSVAFNRSQADNINPWSRP